MLRTGSSPQIFDRREHVSDYTYFIGDRFIGAQITGRLILPTWKTSGRSALFQATDFHRHHAGDHGGGRGGTVLRQGYPDAGGIGDPAELRAGPDRPPAA